MSKKKKKFNSIWASTTDIGRFYGLSAIAVGRVLEKEGLKIGREPTTSALEQGFAKSTPLKNGIPHFMWSKDKVGSIIGKICPRISEVDVTTNAIVAHLKSVEREAVATGMDKLLYLSWDVAFDDVPEKIKDEVKSKVAALLNK